MPGLWKSIGQRRIGLLVLLGSRKREKSRHRTRQIQIQKAGSVKAVRWNGSETSPLRPRESYGFDSRRIQPCQHQCAPCQCAPRILTGSLFHARWDCVTYSRQNALFLRWNRDGIETTPPADLQYRRPLRGGFGSGERSRPVSSAIGSGPGRFHGDSNRPR